MTELEKMQRAKMYIDKLANGINPLDDNFIEDSDVINNVRISRCLFYVSEILGNVIDNDGIIVKNIKSLKPFSLDDGVIEKFAFSETPISVSEIANRLNNLVNLDVYRKFKYSAITRWLLEIGALEIIAYDGKNPKRPTVQGNELGIFLESRMGQYGEYQTVLYNKDAQHFIIDNIDAILAHDASKNKKTAENQGNPWTPAHEECLKDLFSKSVSVAEIATTLKRTEEGIRARLKKLGLIEHRSEVE